MEQAPGDRERQGSLRAAVHGVAEWDVIERLKTNNSGRSVSLPMGLLCALCLLCPGVKDAPKAGCPGTLKDPTVPSFLWAVPGWGQGQFRVH